MNAAERSKLERAFNILAHTDLRNCYDTLRRDEDAPPLFPYGGFGSILVEGQLSGDSAAFFGHRVLAYKSEMISRRVSLLVRNCEFFADRIICRDTRRKLEVWLDSNLLPGVSWDLTWNHWKHWLKTRIDVDATFVHAGKYRLKNGEWILGAWYTALPSRLRVTIPDGLATDAARAKAIHTLLGEHADVARRVRAEVEKQPVEHVVIQDWFDRLCIFAHLKPQHVTWRPDYEPYYFEQLRKTNRTWFLFRNEYLFVWTHVLISEVPQQGHATYIFGVLSARLRKPTFGIMVWRAKSMNWVSVDSSVFSSVAYLHGKRLLYLRFHSGYIYRYFEFPPDQYDEFVAADSKGEYFAYNIRDKFRYEQVREAQTFTTGSR